MIVYSGEDEEYYTYISREAFLALKEWIKYRQDSGELIDESSWLMRDLWDTGAVREGNGEYYGGHKSYLAGEKFGDHELGSMYLTNQHFIFNKNNKDLKNDIEIIIPVNSINIDQWQIKEESRRKNITMASSGSDHFLFTSGTVNESGKRYRLVIPYTDVYGINHSPVFGISSMGGKAIREWASVLYQIMSDHEKTSKEEGEEKTLEYNNNIKKENDYAVNPIAILKLRFAKGEISKDEFEEMKKLLEQSNDD